MDDGDDQREDEEKADGFEFMVYLRNKIGFMFPTGTGIPTQRVGRPLG